MNSKSALKLKYKSVNWLYILIVVVILAIFSGLRIFGIDRDYSDYLMYFDSLTGFNPDPNRIYRFKIGFEIFSKLIAGFTSNFNIYIFFLTFFSLLPKVFLMAKHSRNLIVSIFIYGLFIFPLHEMTQMRSGFAYALFYLGIYFLNNSKNLFGFLLMIMSSTIHIATLSLSFLFFIFKYFINEKITIFKQLILLIIFFLFFHILSKVGLSLIPLGLGQKYFTFLQAYANVFSYRYAILLLITLIGLRYQKQMPSHANNWFRISLFGLTVFYSMPYLKILACRVIEASYLSYLLWIDYLPKNLRIFSKIALVGISISSIYLMNSQDFFSN